jgi:hypothetical protein
MEPSGPTPGRSLFLSQQNEAAMSHPTLHPFFPPRTTAIDGTLLYAGRPRLLSVPGNRHGQRAWWIRRSVEDEGDAESFEPFAGPFDSERDAEMEIMRVHARAALAAAIREAVEGEREACAKLVAAHGIAGMPFDVGSWTPGAVAAAIRARGEEKGK